MSSAAYADSRFATMQVVQATEGITALCYAQQAALVESVIRPGMTVLDIGCGPALPYDASPAFVIGLDPSAESLSVNTDVDDRIVGSAESIPLPSQSVDLVVCLYALHHMTGQNAQETYLIRSRAFSEMQRVLRPGGQLLVFEMAPTPVARFAQWALWPMAKRLLGDRLDTYFEAALPFSLAQTFDCPPFETFAPIFVLPSLRIPRFLYPFSAVVYRWSKE